MEAGGQEEGDNLQQIKNADDLSKAVNEVFLLHGIFVYSFNFPGPN